MAPARAYERPDRDRFPGRMFSPREPDFKRKTRGMVYAADAGAGHVKRMEQGEAAVEKQKAPAGAEAFSGECPGYQPRRASENCVPESAVQFSWLVPARLQLTREVVFLRFENRLISTTPFGCVM